MSINWVMIAETGGYTPLPGEQTLYTSPPRTTLSLQTANRHTPSQAYSQQCKSGVVYLTNRRIIYLPVSATPTLESFAVPILNVTDSRVTAPWFGANKWEGVIQPVHGGGIPAQHSELEMVMEFKEGGAFDFATTFERLKERLKQAVEVAREGEGVDLGDARGAGALDGVNLNSVHLDELPAYEESGHDTVVPVGPLDALPAPRPMGRNSVVASVPEPCVQSSPLASPQRGTFSPPSEPPPGYEEVQRGSIVDELERRLREPEQGSER